jgi:hypothetical protein
MGNCCDGGPMITEELKNCKTIQEIQTYLSLKLKEANTEQEELKAYLKDKNKKPTMIDITGFKDEDIQKRVPYLDEMKDCILRVHDLLKSNPDIDLQLTKNKLVELYNMYTWLYDDEKRYENWMFNFKQFVESNDFEKIKVEPARGTMPVKGSKTLKNYMDEQKKKNNEV